VLQFFCDGADNLETLRIGDYAAAARLCMNVGCDPEAGVPSIGIAHTRWATHGAVRAENAHPQTDYNIAVAHNGIIENFVELKAALLADNEYIYFRSQTDTEVIAHLITKECAQFEEQTNENFLRAVILTLRQLKGSFALAIASKHFPNVMIAARKDSPLVVGLGRDELAGDVFLASDSIAIAPYIAEYVDLENGDVCMIDLQPTSAEPSSEESKESMEENETFRCRFFDFNLREHDDATQSGSPDVRNISLNPIQKQWSKFTYDDTTHEKEKFPDFTSREIFEQQGVLEDVVKALENGEFARFAKLCLPVDYINFIACGSSLYAGIVGKYILEKYCGIIANAECASEFAYRDPVVKKGGLYVFISQSGETSDTLKALAHTTRAEAAENLIITNVLRSSLAKKAKHVIPLNAGPEFGVVSTKAFTSQLAAIVCLAIELLRGNARHFSDVNGTVTNEAAANGTAASETASRLLSDFRKVPTLVRQTLQSFSTFKPGSPDFAIIETLAAAKSVLFLGRGINYPIALESALKFKEVTYIHAEGCPAGEMKHGPIALIDTSVVSVFIAPSDELMEKTTSNIQEIVARCGTVVLLTDQRGFELIAKLNLPAKYVLTHLLPETGDFSKIFVYSVIGQILAYKTAKFLDLNIDMPRNLAKSVTVE
jgi:glucosamine--fructose-6-phosphate aminotransferase (isomerizing)